MSSKSRSITRRRGVVLFLAVTAAAAALGRDADAATLNWKGHTWQVTSGGMAGVCQGSPSNVTVDANGYLHFKISNNGGTWTASEIFTTEKLGFGTYQWQVDGPIDKFDKNVVLGLFPYGPQAGIGGDGTNEIDIEYSRWGQANGVNGDWTDYPASGKTIGELSYDFTLGGATLSTSRFVWSKTSITSSLLGGLAPVGMATGLIKTWTYMPQNPTTNIPQQALPLGMNLWCFSAPPSDGKPVEIVIRDFQFVPADASTGAGGSGAAGAGGAGGAGGSGGHGGAGGRSGAGGAGGIGGMSGVGGASGIGGTGGVGGAAGIGGTGGVAGASGAGGGPSPSAGGASGGGDAGASAASSSGAAGASTGTAGAPTGAAGAPTGNAGAPDNVGAAGGGAVHGGAASSGGCSMRGGPAHDLGAVALLLACIALARRRR